MYVRTYVCSSLGTLKSSHEAKGKTSAEDTRYVDTASTYLRIDTTRTKTTELN